ncbi:hypothetical protein BDN72DRAFT_905193 [Pluteus cervinus]|uniref:Uncharacterized protein n=1 Tax=Pluteus cervinus TaxID=181527 RepID=A0ACD3A4G6_9AGAR|nr:hypothetical protein BDN72DRAFT_905193 [Pluteus cervinus]
MDDDLLPRTELQSISDNCYRAQHLLDSQEEGDKFVNFVLAGRDGRTQAVVDPLMNRARDEDSFTVTRDYDSVLGFYTNIVVRDTRLMMYPVAHRDDTLSKNVHLEYRFTRSTGTFTAPIHRVPNICVAKWSTHNSLRVYIPELYDEGSAYPFLTQHQQATFYESGLRPAMEELIGDKVHEWPTTYEAEMFRARARSGALKFQSKIVPAWRVQEIGDALRRALEENGTNWHHGLVFLHQLRGLKHSSTHSMDGHSAEQALLAFSKENHLVDAGQLRGDWWIDVGLEIGSPDGHCLAWRTDSHFHVVQHVLDISNAGAERITSLGSSSYSRDLTSHLAAVSGCRIVPGVYTQGDSEAAYLQMYTTDKSLIYLPDGGYYGKFIKPSDTLSGKAMNFITKLYDLYVKASKKNSSLARIEVRVPIAQALAVLLDFDDDLIRESLVVIPREDWWSWRAYRTLAIKYVLEWQSDGPPEYRGSPLALVLTAGVTWMLNCLHSTPDYRNHSRELLEAILPSIARADADQYNIAFGSLGRVFAGDEDAESSDDEDADRPSYPGFPFGAIFLDGLCVGRGFPVPRMVELTPTLGERAFKFFFDASSSKITEQLAVTRAIVPSNPLRINNRTRQTQQLHNPPQVATMFKLGGSVRLNPPQQDKGLDVDEPEFDANNPAHVARKAAKLIVLTSLDADLVCETLWFQFLHDIMEKAPNHQLGTAPSFCKLDLDERLNATDATFRNQTLSDIFYTCRWKVVDDHTDVNWMRVFDHLWLDLGKVKVGKTQNYRSMWYFKWWELLKDRTSATGLSRMRTALRSQFDKLYWIPYAQADRVWNTKVAKSFTAPRGLPSFQTAPQLLVRSLDPNWKY